MFRRSYVHGSRPSSKSVRPGRFQGSEIKQHYINYCLPVLIEYFIVLMFLLIGQMFKEIQVIRVRKAQLAFIKQTP